MISQISLGNHDLISLEKTIAELTEESEQKSYYLKILNNEKGILIQESLDMEVSFEQQVQKQKAIIEGQESCIRALKRKKESTGTKRFSTSNKTVNQSTNTEKLIMGRSKNKQNEGPTIHHEYGNYVGTYPKEHLNNQAVTAIVKPQKNFENVTYIIKKHTQSFGKDFVCIIVSKSNFTKKDFNSFKSIKTTLAACSITNINTSIKSIGPLMNCSN